jgi:hypothetical protein
MVDVVVVVVIVVVVAFINKKYKMTSVIIGFRYEKTKPLYGVVHDVSLMKEYCSNMDKRILTDDNYHNVDDIYNLLSNCSNRLILYYSGHAKNSCFIMPDGKTLCMSRLREVIKYMINGEVLAIMDCCNSNGMGLPYRLDNNKFEVNENSLIGEYPNIVCISSAKINEDAVMSQDGSIFTHTLVNILKHNIKYMPCILDKLNSVCKQYKHTANIYSTSRNMILWNWVYGVENYNISLIDNELIVDYLC